MDDAREPVGRAGDVPGGGVVSATRIGLQAALARIREERAIVLGACHQLADSLRTGTTQDGLTAVARICVALFIIDDLVGFLSRAAERGRELEEARDVRESLLGQASPWLAAAVRDLPGSDALLRVFVGVAAGKAGR